MPFYGFFVTVKNHDFSELFRPYWKRDESYVAFDDAKSSSLTPFEISKVICRSWYRITCP